MRAAPWRWSRWIQQDHHQAVGAVQQARQIAGVEDRLGHPDAHGLERAGRPGDGRLAVRVAYGRALIGK